jgi:hypothetical protein
MSPCTKLRLGVIVGERLLFVDTGVHHFIGYDAENYSRYGKSKVMPGSDHEGPEGKNSCSSDLSLTSALDRGW